MTDKSGESTEVDKMTEMSQKLIDCISRGVDSVCPSVCLSPSISFGSTRPFLPFFLHVTYVRGSVLQSLAVLRYVMYFRCMDVVMCVNNDQK